MKQLLETLWWPPPPFFFCFGYRETKLYSTRETDLSMQFCIRLPYILLKKSCTLDLDKPWTFTTNWRYQNRSSCPWVDYRKIQAHYILILCPKENLFRICFPKMLIVIHNDIRISILILTYTQWWEVRETGYINFDRCVRVIFASKPLLNSILCFFKKKLTDWGAEILCFTICSMPCQIQLLQRLHDGTEVFLKFWIQLLN